MRPGMVVHPLKGREKADDLRRRLGETLLEEETTEDDPGTGQVRRLLDRGADLVVACGGDGTVRACAEAVVGTGVPLVALPAGTGNLFVRNLDLPEDVDAVAETIDHGHDDRIDVGSVEGEVFLLMAGVGFDAHVVEDADERTKEHVGVMAYLSAALHHLDDPPIAMRVTVDGETETLEAATLLVGNLGRLRGGLSVFPEADPADGLLDVAAVTASGVSEWLAAVRDAAGGAHRDTDIRRWTTTRCSVRLERPTPYQLDGEHRGETVHLRFEVRPLALTIRRPKGHDR